MPVKSSTTRSQRYQNVLNNPHSVDWYYSFRLSVFIKVFFEDILVSQWIYYRYERQSRDAIHLHGVFRLKNDPRIAALTSLVFNGKLKQQLLP